MNTQLKVGHRVRVIHPSGNGFFNGTYIERFPDDFHKILEDGKSEENYGMHIVYGKSDDGKDRIIPIPTPKWLPIDRDNLPVERVAVRNNENQTRYGKLWVYGTRVRVDNDSILNPTHYIPLTDLLNLPISE